MFPVLLFLSIKEWKILLVFYLCLFPFSRFLKTQTETVNDCDKSFICLKGTMKQMNFSFCQAEKTAFLGSTSMATNDGKMCYAGIEISTQQVINKKSLQNVKH